MIELGRVLRPILLTNHPNQSAVAPLISPKANQNIVLIRAYQQLVTHHNVDPSLAKKLLGLPESL